MVMMMKLMMEVMVSGSTARTIKSDIDPPARRFQVTSRIDGNIDEDAGPTAWGESRLDGSGAGRPDGKGKGRTVGMDGRIRPRSNPARRKLG